MKPTLVDYSHQLTDQAKSNLNYPSNKPCEKHCRCVIEIYGMYYEQFKNVSHNKNFWKGQGHNIRTNTCK